MDQTASKCCAPKRSRNIESPGGNGRSCSVNLSSLFLLHTVSQKTQPSSVSPKQVEVSLQQSLALNEMDHFADKILCGIALLEYMFIENDIYIYIYLQSLLFFCLYELMENNVLVLEKIILPSDFISLSPFISNIARFNVNFQRPRMPVQYRSEILSALQVAGYTSKHLVHSVQDH